MLQMTKIISSLAIIAGIVTLASCTTVKDRDPAPSTSSTTTESTSIQQPAPVVEPATTETQTVRSY
jgi:PBP1b-binding outer membrane lipoprotein LpoB